MNGTGRDCTPKPVPNHRHWRCPMATKQSIPERFWTKVQKTRTCWLWTAAQSTNGYGRFGVGTQTLAAHRVAWFLTSGTMPSLCVCHRCDVRLCVRPDHLFLGTYADNLRDMRLKGRGRGPSRGKNWALNHPERCARGEALPFSKLREDDVRLIRLHQASGRSMGSLARQFGVGQPCIMRVVTRKTWKHVE